MPTPNLFDLLAHPVALDAMQSLSRGASPKGVLAGIAGDLVAAKVAEALGTTVVKPKKATKTEKKADDDIIDADFKVINVTPRASKAK